MNKWCYLSLIQFSESILRLSKEREMASTKTTQEKVTDLIFRSNWFEVMIIALAIVILVLVCLTWPVASRSLNSVSLLDGVCTSGNTAVESDECNDGNPCTLDIKQRVNTGCTRKLFVNQSAEDGACQEYQCTNVPLATGSCCNRDDFCYFDDPNKKCYNGVCKSLDPTLCKGYCEVDDDCRNEFKTIPLQINDTTYAAGYEPFCIFNSCTQFVSFNARFTDPLAMVYPYNGNLSLFNFSKCVNVVCYKPDLSGVSGFNTCLYTWKCAPYLNLPYPPPPASGKKRSSIIEWDPSSNTTDDTVINDTIPVVPVFTRSVSTVLTLAQRDKLNKFAYQLALQYIESRRLLSESYGANSHK
jgi:hypothetical protein